MKPSRPLLAPLLFLGILVAAAGCSSAAPAPPAAKSSAPGTVQNVPGAPSAQDSSSAIPERMVVRTAYLQLVVSNVEETLDKISKLAREGGGFVVSSESQERDGNRIGKAAIRVPADRLDESLGRIRGMATKVEKESATNKDVTEEYVDQDARLNTLRATEDRYLQLLKEAKSTDDILKINQSLGQVREQIERTEGRMTFLKRSTEMSLITIDLSTTAASRPIDSAGWNPPETIAQALHAMVDTLMMLGALAIWIVVYSPIWLPTVLLWRWWRGRRRKAAPPVPPAQPVT